MSKSISDPISEFSQSIQWPQGIDQQRFLNEYWQQKPLLIRNAFTNFESPLPADELAGLSLEPDTTGKIITRDTNGAYRIEYGPFTEERFDSLTDNNWSLLVTDVEKYLPQLLCYLQPFRFIADWRIDDLMISYAPDGASVGAHVDEYDVFLLQGSGVRTWGIDERKNITHILRRDGDLKILEDFQASSTWDLKAGDMLYLPPGVAHHGTAKGDDCTTWSIGFRAPLMSDIFARLAELISESMPALRYSDSAPTPAVPGEISDATLQTFRRYWIKTSTLGDHEFAQLLGRCLTESSGAPEAFQERACSAEQYDQSDQHKMVKSPFSQFAWRRVSQDKAILFVDGTSYPCSLKLAQTLCATASVFDAQEYSFHENDQTLLRSLNESGSLLRYSGDA